MTSGLTEHLSAERAWLQVRIESARIRTHPDQAVAPLRWLDQIQGLVEQSRMDPKRQMTALQQAAFRTSVERFPASSSLYRLALMEAHHGRPDAATRALQTLCSMHPPLACATAISVWRDAAVGDAALSLVRLPDPIV